MKGLELNEAYTKLADVIRSCSLDAGHLGRSFLYLIQLSFGLVCVLIINSWLVAERGVVVLILK